MLRPGWFASQRVEVVVTRHFHDLVFTAGVWAEQVRQGSRAALAAPVDPASSRARPDTLSRPEIDFINTRDSFYLATVSEAGWPYVQHRGGPVGFVRCLNEWTFGWAEFAGNRQYVSTGNIAANDKAAIILVDYPNRTRLKILGHMSTHDEADRPDLALRLNVSGAKVERFVLIAVEAFDWNCPQYITPRFTLAEVERLVAPLHAKIAEQEALLANREPTSV
jgi:predicted pyridoxine 5'-phosphate oxidase superfamily flavin-nucleotide-binding protein